MKKNGVFPNCDCVNTNAWMQHIDANQTYGGKAWWELRENATSYIEQILEVTHTKQLLYGHLPLISKTI